MTLITGFRLITAFATLFVLTNCADSRQKDQWNNIDYSKVRNRDTYENDRNYKLPSVVSCTDDDLYNCK